VQAYYRRLQKEDRAEQLRLTVIASIDNKLKRMDFNELRKVLSTATQIMERKKEYNAPTPSVAYIFTPNQTYSKSCSYRTFFGKR